MSDSLSVALQRAIEALRKRDRRFALVGGLAVSVRAEVRFTRDVDLAVAVQSDTDAEALVRDLSTDGFVPVATVEHEVVHRLSTVRLLLGGVKIDLLFASSGIEPEIVADATELEVLDVGKLAVASAIDLLAMKVLSMSDARLQDRIDAQKLLRFCADIQLDRVRERLRLIAQRGFDRGEDLEHKLESLLVKP